MIVKRFITQNKVVYFTTNQQKEIIQKATKRLRNVIQTILELYTEPKKKDKTDLKTKKIVNQQTLQRNNTKPTETTEMLVSFIQRFFLLILH